jgi:hypothetical protein
MLLNWLISILPDTLLLINLVRDMAMLLMINLTFLPLKINILGYHMGRHRRICWFQWFLVKSVVILCYHALLTSLATARIPKQISLLKSCSVSGRFQRPMRPRLQAPRHPASPLGASQRRRWAHVLRPPRVYLAPASMSPLQGGKAYLHRIRRTRRWIFYSDRIFCACTWVLCSKRIHYASSRSFSMALANSLH